MRSRSVLSIMVFALLFLVVDMPLIAQVMEPESSIKRDASSYMMLGAIDDHTILIKDTIDLKGNVCRLPVGITLHFDSGYIKNGVLIGNMTKLIYNRPCFSQVEIRGTWNVPVINSFIFGDINHNNTLKNLMALSHPSIKNTVIIHEGEYMVSSLKNNDACININSNSEVHSSCQAA